MKIKKFYGKTLKSATEAMKNELGDEAFILGTRVVTKNDVDGKRDIFEVTCGIEDDIDDLQKEDKSPKRKIALKENIDFKKVIKNDIDVIPDTEIRIEKKKDKASVPGENLKDELKEAVDLLKARDVNNQIISLMLKYLKKSRQFLNSDNLDSFIINGMSSLINADEFRVSRKMKPMTVAFVGPTGVGKTTCVAKLAAISKLVQNLNIGIISIDTYRLGAIDQLRIFSEISNVDMLVAYEPDEMPILLEKMKDKDIIFIDTTGRNQKNKSELEKMNEFFEQIKIDKMFLVLSATGASKTLIDAAEKFDIYNYDSIIFSKIDEAVTHGAILNLLVRQQKPITFLTNGQTIPDDILPADPEYLSKLIYFGSNERL